MKDNANEISELPVFVGNKKFSVIKKKDKESWSRSRCAKIRNSPA